MAWEKRTSNYNTKPGFFWTVTQDVLLLPCSVWALSVCRSGIEPGVFQAEWTCRSYNRQRKNCGYAHLYTHRELDYCKDSPVHNGIRPVLLFTTWNADSRAPSLSGDCNTALMSHLHKLRKHTCMHICTPTNIPIHTQTYKYMYLLVPGISSPSSCNLCPPSPISPSFRVPVRSAGVAGRREELRSSLVRLSCSSSLPWGSWKSSSWEEDDLEGGGTTWTVLCSGRSQL